MKILVIDDDLSRANEIRELINLNCDLPNKNIYHSKNTLDARIILKSNYYDIVILDVVLPKRDGDNPNYTNGLELLEVVTKHASYTKPEKIIGITAHIDDISKFRNKFENYCFSIIEASNNNLQWKKNLIESIKYTSSSKISRLTIDKPILVFTVHGIRTFGKWQHDFEKIVSDKVSTVSFQSYKYGYSTLISFFFPPLRKMEANKFSKALDRAISENKDKTLYFFSHSFGTYLTVNAVQDLLNNDFPPPIDLIVLSASVLPSNFNWSNLMSKSSFTLVNDCGDSDYVLWLSEAFVPLTGMSGKIGFYGLNNKRFVNRIFNGGHSHYFDKGNNFIKKYWLPLFYSEKDLSVIDERKENALVHGILEKVVMFLGTIKHITYISMLLALMYFVYLTISST